MISPKNEHFKNDLVMDDIINIIEGEHDTFTVTSGKARLSDAIDDFKQSETIVQ